MSPISSFQPNISYSIDPLNALDSTFSFLDESGQPLVSVETIAKARETAARALDKNSILCPVLLNADICVYTEPNSICSCPSNSQELALSPHHERSLTAAVRRMITRVRTIAERELKKTYPDSIIPGCLSLNEINAEAPASSAAVKKSPPCKKKKQSAILKKKQPKTVQKRQSVPSKTPPLSSVRLLAKKGPLTDEEMKVIKELKGRNRYFGECSRYFLDGIFYRFSKNPIHAWKEVGEKFKGEALLRIRGYYQRCRKAGLFTQMAAVLNKPELNRLIKHNKALKARDNLRSLTPLPEFKIVTNKEWNLIKSFITTENRSRYSSRECFDGILHKYTSEKSLWNLIKKNIRNTKYTFQQRLRIEYDKWQRGGIFAAVHNELAKKKLFPKLKKRLDALLQHSSKKPDLSPDFDIVTNEQWSLIEPFLIVRRNREYSIREYFNGILHRYTGGKSSWNLIKKRFENNGYNFQQRIRVQYGRWKKDGCFTAAHEELAKKNRFPELQKKLAILIKRSNQERELIPRLPIIADAEEPNHFENPEKVTYAARGDDPSSSSSPQRLFSSEINSDEKKLDSPAVDSDNEELNDCENADNSACALTSAESNAPLSPSFLSFLDINNDELESLIRDLSNEELKFCENADNSAYVPRGVDSNAPSILPLLPFPQIDNDELESLIRGLSNEELN